MIYYLFDKKKIFVGHKKVLVESGSDKIRTVIISLPDQDSGYAELDPEEIFTDPQHYLRPPTPHSREKEEQNLLSQVGIDGLDNGLEIGDRCALRLVIAGDLLQSSLQHQRK